MTSEEKRILKNVEKPRNRSNGINRENEVCNILLSLSQGGDLSIQLKKQSENCEGLSDINESELFAVIKKRGLIHAVSADRFNDKTVQELVWRAQNAKEDDWTGKEFSKIEKKQLRRVRNRTLAKQSRDRKKKYLEELEADNLRLRKENEELKDKILQFELSGMRKEDTNLNKDESPFGT
eukprot:snap_masked-scaffold_3-processed-gene-7.19-mRNA-1 protein AED:1.00 eAED:1.00 QI:0/-1/0/0/-1/1/1/0/179